MDDPLLGIDNKYEGLHRTGRLCGAVRNDFARRSKFCLSDYSDGFHQKTLSAFLYMFFATFASTVALGVVVDDRHHGTNNCMGVTELVLSLTIAGIVHSLFSGCPMAVLRPTGPITLFIIKLYCIGEALDVDFFSWLAWTGFWVGIYSMLIAAFDLCRHIRLATRFLHDMFSFFVCTIYIHDGVAGIAGLWPDPVKQIGDKRDWENDNCETNACGYFSIILYLITLGGALALNSCTSTSILSRWGRETVKDYALTISVITSVCIGYMGPGAEDWRQPDYIPHVALPGTLSPTFNGLPSHNNTSRSWWIGLGVGTNAGAGRLGEYNSTQFGLFNSTALDKICGNNDASCAFNSTNIAFAAVAAIPITFWFYFDQLFSCILHQVGMGPNCENLEKGAYYHSSFLIVGFCNLILPLFGLPFITASLPHSPQFVRALQIEHRDEGGGRRVRSVIDSRLAPLMMYIMCGIALFLPAGNGHKLLELIPKGVVYGILTYVGVAGVLPETGNQLSLRLLLLVTSRSEYPSNNPAKPFVATNVSKMHLYTALQTGALIICWIITISNTLGTGQFWQYVGIFFPLWIVALIPIRLRLFPKLFSPVELLEQLDVEKVDNGYGDVPLDPYFDKIVN